MPPLVNVFIDQVCRMHNLQRLAIGDDAMAVLQAQEWPGNARQLRNSIERLLILMKDQQPEDGIITAAMLPSDIGEVLPTVGFEHHGVSQPITINHSLQSKPMTRSLKTASGFGGCNAAIVLQKKTNK